jgi:hypothetical protein
MGGHWMSKFTLLGVMLAVLIAVGAALTLKLPKLAAAQHPSALDPLILHGALQGARQEMALP